MAIFLVRALNLHRAAQLGRIVGARVGCKDQALVGQTISCTFSDCLDVPDIGCIRLAGFCNVASAIFFNTSTHVSDLAAAHTDIAATDSRRTICAQFDLGPGRLIAFRLLVADGGDTRQVFGKLNFQFAIYCAVDADVLFSQLRAVCTTDDIQLVIQLLGNNSFIIALELQTIFHRGNLVFTSLVRIDDTGQTRSVYTVRTLNAILAISTCCSIIAILDRNIDGCTRLSVGSVLAIRSGRACQADMAHAILAGDGNRIFAILAIHSNLICRDILIHQDSNVATSINFRSQVISGVFMAIFLVRALNLHRAAQLSRVFITRVSSELQALTCQILCQTGLQRFQLCHVDSIGVICAGSQAGKLTSYFISYFFISVTNGYSCSCGRPCNTIIP